jgi:hypothetical protein
MSVHRLFEGSCWEARERLQSDRGSWAGLFKGTEWPPLALNLWRKDVPDLCYLSSRDIHVIRQKLQLVLAVADGPNSPIIERSVKDIDLLLPKPTGEWFRNAV